MTETFSRALREAHAPTARAWAIETRTTDGISESLLICTATCQPSIAAYLAAGASGAAVPDADLNALAEAGHGEPVYCDICHGIIAGTPR